MGWSHTADKNDNIFKDFFPQHRSNTAEMKYCRCLVLANFDGHFIPRSGFFRSIIFFFWRSACILIRYSCHATILVPDWSFQFWLRFNLLISYFCSVLLFGPLSRWLLPSLVVSRPHINCTFIFANLVLWCSGNRQKKHQGYFRG